MAESAIEFVPFDVMVMGWLKGEEEVTLPEGVPQEDEAQYILRNAIGLLPRCCPPDKRAEAIEALIAGVSLEGIENETVGQIAWALQELGAIEERMKAAYLATKEESDEETNLRYVLEQMKIETPERPEPETAAAEEPPPPPPAAKPKKAKKPKKGGESNEPPFGCCGRPGGGEHL